jgi:hypothetical protein|tara:strand:+ start:10892 stop:11497 length:606 start_codon:yes stop_codon:yes gene_type:complete
MAGRSDVQAITVSDEVAASTTFIAAAARPNTAFTLANTSFASGGARNITVTTAGTGDNEKTVTIVGTDVFGDSMTEVITSTGSAETVAGTKLFKTVSSATCSAQYAANVSVGSGTLAAQAVLGSNRVRLKGFSIVSGGSAGVINFYNGAPEDGTILFKSRTIGTDNTTVDRTIPEDGVLFENGFVVNYTIGTIDMMTFFYA